MQTEDAWDRVLETHEDQIPDEIETEEQLREWVDAHSAYRDVQIDHLEEKIEQLEAEAATSDDISQTREFGAKTRKEVRALERKVEALQRKVTTGGIGKNERLYAIVDELCERAVQAKAEKTTITVDRVKRKDVNGNPYHVDGIYEILDEQVSKRTVRKYIDDLGEFDGFTVVESSSGGFGGGQTQKKLKFDLSAFRDAYGESWEP